MSRQGHLALLGLMLTCASALGRPRSTDTEPLVTPVLAVSTTQPSTLPQYGPTSQPMVALQSEPQIALPLARPLNLSYHTWVPLDESPRYWGEVDYLLWWLGNVSPPPLVSTGNPADSVPGALGQPGTRVLFGGSNGLDLGSFSGVRAQAGAWLGEWCGAELVGFMLFRKTERFSQTSDAAGNPPIYVPFDNYNPLTPPLPHEGSFTVADPLLLGGVNGNITVTAATQLWGAEVNGLCRGFSSGGLNAVWLLGFRYLGLDDELSLSGSHRAFVIDNQQTWRDRFYTQNNFYGGQLGSKLSWTNGLFLVDFTGKVALGGTQQVVSVSGSSTNSDAGAANPGSFPGGAVFALPSNLGRRVEDDFTVVPQLQLKVGCNLTRFCTGFCGYDFLYWSSVVRAGDQLDRRVNDSQAIGGVLVGDPLPTRQFNRSDLLVHGVTFGILCRY